MPESIRVCRLDEIPEGGGEEFAVGDQVIAIFRTDEGLYAIDGLCPHAGGPIGKGTLRQRIVTCPWHGWQFDVATGQSCLSKSVQTKTFPVHVEQDEVFVTLPETSD